MKNEEEKITKTRNAKRGEQNECNRRLLLGFWMTSRGGLSILRDLKGSMAYGRRAAFGAVGT